MNKRVGIVEKAAGLLVGLAFIVVGLFLLLLGLTFLPVIGVILAWPVIGMALPFLRRQARVATAAQPVFPLPALEPERQPS